MMSQTSLGELDKTIETDENDNYERGNALIEVTSNVSNDNDENKEQFPDRTLLVTTLDVNDTHELEVIGMSSSYDEDDQPLSPEMLSGAKRASTRSRNVTSLSPVGQRYRALYQELKRHYRHMTKDYKKRLAI